MCFSQGDFIRSEKVELKENYNKRNFFFLFERSHVQTKRKDFVYKEIQSLRIFPVCNFFCTKKILFTKNKDFPYAHILYRLWKVHFRYFYSIGNL